MAAESHHLIEGTPSGGRESVRTILEPRFEVGTRPHLRPPQKKPLFDLTPWRWPHWVLLLVGPLFIVAYLSLFSWVPVDEAIARLQGELGQRGVLQDSLLRAETILGLVCLLLLTPLAGLVALFLLLFGMVIVVTIFGPIVRAVGLPDWILVLPLGGAASRVAYGQSEVWLPWSMWFLDRVTTIYLVLFL